MLHNYLPCGYTTSKFERNVSSTCEYCGTIENIKHMLFICPRINAIWSNISNALQIDISWPLLVCGSMQRDISTKVQCQNIILSYIMYSIFKVNIRSKYEKKNYKNIDVKMNIKLDLSFQKTVILKSKYKSRYMYMLLIICN